MEKDWEARFTGRQNEGHLSKWIRSKRLEIATAYWITVLLAYFVPALAGFDMAGAGCWVLVVLTVPWSIIAFFAEFALSSQHSEALTRVLQLDTQAGTFFVLTVLCGGLNALLIVGPASAMRGLRDAWNNLRGV